MSWMDYNSQDWTSFKGVMNDEPEYEEDHYNAGWAARGTAAPGSSKKRARDGREPRKSKKAKEVTDESEWAGYTAAPAAELASPTFVPVANVAPLPALPSVALFSGGRRGDG